MDGSIRRAGAQVARCSAVAWMATAMAMAGAGRVADLPGPGEPGWFLVSSRGFVTSGTGIHLASLRVSVRPGRRVPEDLIGTLRIARSRYRLGGIRTRFEEIPVPMPAIALPPGAATPPSTRRRLVGLAADLFPLPRDPEAPVPAVSPSGLPGPPGSEAGLAIEDSPATPSAFALRVEAPVGEIRIRLVPKPFGRGHPRVVQGAVTVAGKRWTFMGRQDPRRPPAVSGPSVPTRAYAMEQESDPDGAEEDVDLGAEDEDVFDLP